MPLDHEFIFTITGRCARNGCGRFEEEHPKFAHGRAPDQCAVDHGSVNVHRLIGDDGEEWTRCPVCLSHIEPILPDDTSATGRKRLPYGPGRLPYTNRQIEKLRRLKAAFEAGYYKS